MKHFYCIILTALLLTGCANTPAPATAPLTETTAPATTQATEPPVTTVPPTEMPTEAPIVWGENIHSGIQADGSFDSGTLFIGDSLTQGLICQYLMPEKRIGDARYLTRVGAPLAAFFSDEFLMEEPYSVYTWYFEGKTYADSVILAPDATAIYFMMGTNFDTHNSPEAYIRIVEYLLSVCPRATVYLQRIPYSTSENVHVEAVNTAIEAAYDHFSQAGIQQVMLIDTFGAIGENLLADGVHLTKEGQRLWYEAIVNFAAENQLPQ